MLTVSTSTNAACYSDDDAPAVGPMSLTPKLGQYQPGPYQIVVRLLLVRAPDLVRMVVMMDRQLVTTTQLVEAWKVVRAI